MWEKKKEDPLNSLPLTPLTGWGWWLRPPRDSGGGPGAPDLAYDSVALRVMLKAKFGNLKETRKKQDMHLLGIPEHRCLGDRTGLNQAQGPSEHKALCSYTDLMLRSQPCL